MPHTFNGGQYIPLKTTATIWKFRMFFFPLLSMNKVYISYCPDQFFFPSITFSIAWMYRTANFNQKVINGIEMIREKQIFQNSLWIEMKIYATLFNNKKQKIIRGFHPKIDKIITSNSDTSAGRFNAFVRERVCRIFRWFLYHLSVRQFCPSKQNCSSV